MRVEGRGRCLRWAWVPRDAKTNEEAWWHDDDSSFVAKHTGAFFHASAIAHTELISRDVALAAWTTGEIPSVVHVLKTCPFDISLHPHEAQERAMLCFGMVTHGPYPNLP